MGCELLAGVLERHTGFEVLTCSDPCRLLQTVASQKTNVALISLRVGDQLTAGFTTMERVRDHCPATRVIALLDCSRVDQVVQAFCCGAKGIFCRTDSFKNLARCIQCVQRGQVWASSAQMEMALDALAQTTPTHLLDTKGMHLLSGREEQTVSMVCCGMTNRQIARQLHLSEHTVKNYLFHIFEKLGISSRIELVLYSQQARLLQATTLAPVPQNTSNGKTAVA